MWNQKLILDSDFFFLIFFLIQGRDSKQENRRQKIQWRSARNDNQPEHRDTHIDRGESRQAKIRHNLKKEGLRNRDDVGKKHGRQGVCAWCMYTTVYGVDGRWEPAV